MKLWLLEPIRPFNRRAESQYNPWEPWYDKAFGFVIRAETEVEARIIASKNHGDEGEDAWLSSELASCIPLRNAGDPGVILRSFRSA
jgi:hypothetical protein